jgi:GT2 family glycosyltransferase/SAM-dependent methyltransferase
MVADGQRSRVGVGRGGWRAEDLVVVVPTRDRWDIVAETVSALARQSVTGFDVVVVVDGEDQRPPPLPGATVVVEPHRGPGGARNAGVRRSRRPLLLFLGDDMVPSPDLVAEHLRAHGPGRDHRLGVLGRSVFHPAVARGRRERWLTWSGSQFDDASIVGDDAGWQRFYSSNVSISRALFVEAGGFDEDFTYYYEDLDLGWRLGRRGLRLRYAPDAVAWHRHRYDDAALERRFFGIGVGERMMVAKHEWFEPWFLGKAERARAASAPGPWWPRVVDTVPSAWPRLERYARRRADQWYLRRLHPALVAGWAAEGDRAELEAYLGEAYDADQLRRHEAAVEEERCRVGDEDRFYRTARSYLYDLTAFSMSGTKAPYLAELRAAVPRGGTLLDYGCGIGADGLRLVADGYQVSFADFANPSTAFLRWRLNRRGLHNLVYDLDRDELPGGFDAVYCFDVIEHVDDPFGFLDRLEQQAALVAVNFLDEDPDDTELHRPLPVPALLDHAAGRGLVRYRCYHGRSHLVLYRGSVAGPRRPLRSAWERRLGRVLPGRPGWFPTPDVAAARRAARADQAHDAVTPAAASVPPIGYPRGTGPAVELAPRRFPSDP